MLRMLRVSALAVAAAAVVVDVPGVGKLRGRTNLGVDAFLGVPYASAPVGPLRWQSPERHEPWEGVRNATHFGHTCTGSKFSTDRFDSEDCLFLNVFRPASRTEAALPVMVWLHGGAFMRGASDLYSGWTMVPATGNAVLLVTLNYRLGAFGWLASRSLVAKDGSTGNFGLQDQRMALKWVTKNIAAFGGDPSRVSIFGQSAGAGSVTAHMVSERSWPYFTYAIMESGSAALWSSKPLDVAEDVYSQLSEKLGCSDSSCLRAASAADVLTAALGVQLSPADAIYSNPWSPVIDGVEFAEPLQRLADKGAFKKTASVAGTTRDEGAYVLIKQGLPEALPESTFDTLVLQPLRQNSSLLPRLKELYSAESYPYPAELGNYSHWWWAANAATTDQSFTCPLRRFTRALAAGGAPAYGYYFVHPPQSTSPETPGSGPGDIVAAHTSEILFVYNCSIQRGKMFEGRTNCDPLTGAGEQQLSRAMAAAWAQFASTGKMEQVGGVEWPLYNASAPSQSNSIVLDVSAAAGGRGIHVGGPDVDRQCDFWDGLA